MSTILALLVLLSILFGGTTQFLLRFIGEDAGRSNTTGNDNVFIGEDAGRDNTTGFDNVLWPGPLLSDWFCRTLDARNCMDEITLSNKYWVVYLGYNISI